MHKNKPQQPDEIVIPATKPAENEPHQPRYLPWKEPLGEIGRDVVGDTVMSYKDLPRLHDVEKFDNQNYEPIVTSANISSGNNIPNAVPASQSSGSIQEALRLIYIYISDAKGVDMICLIIFICYVYCIDTKIISVSYKS